MNILIDILHPAHVHVFNNFIRLMEQHGHKIFVTAREKDVTLSLLDAYKIRYWTISKISKNKAGLFFEWAARTWKLFLLCRRFRPDLLMGCMGPSIAPVGKLLRIPTIAMYNNETAGTVTGWVHRLATRYVTSSSFEQRFGKNHITHNSYHELAYLHPKYFTPNKKIVEDLKIKEKYILVRFVSWQASHDVGAHGITDKVSFVKELAKHARVIISAEKTVPVELSPYIVSIPPEKFHDVLAFASLCVGESATLAAEAACLGIPAVYIANTMRGYTNELEKKYGLVFNFTSQIGGLGKCVELLNDKKTKKEFEKRRKKMLAEKIDLTQWMVELIEKNIKHFSS